MKYVINSVKCRRGFKPLTYNDKQQENEKNLVSIMDHLINKQQAMNLKEQSTQAGSYNLSDDIHKKRKPKTFKL